jgi:competence ComEA-like helix-hairpin-helix protein
MNNKRGRLFAFFIVVFVILLLFVLGAVREATREEAVPVIGTVYFGEDFVTAKGNVGADTIRPQNADSVSPQNAENDSGGRIISAPTAIPAIVNINTATRDELMTLPGVGEVTADRIIEYREKKPFESTEELIEIKGIGETKLAKILPLITV